MPRPNTSDSGVFYLARAFIFLRFRFNRRIRFLAHLARILAWFLVTPSDKKKEGYQDELTTPTTPPKN